MKKSFCLSLVFACAACSAKAPAPDDPRSADTATPAPVSSPAPTAGGSPAPSSQSDAALPPSGDYAFVTGDGQSFPVRIEGDRLIATKDGRSLEGRLERVGEQLCLHADHGRPDCMTRDANGDWADGRVRHGGVRLVPR